jgi:hypothetical protein
MEDENSNWCVIVVVVVVDVGGAPLTRRVAVSVDAPPRMNRILNWYL